MLCLTLFLTECRINDQYNQMSKLTYHLSDNLNTGTRYVLKFLKKSGFHTDM